MERITNDSGNIAECQSCMYDSICKFAVLYAELRIKHFAIGDELDIASIEIKCKKFKKKRERK